MEGRPGLFSACLVPERVPEVIDVILQWRSRNPDQGTLQSKRREANSCSQLGKEENSADLGNLGERETAAPQVRAGASLGAARCSTACTSSGEMSPWPSSSPPNPESSAWASSCSAGASSPSSRSRKPFFLPFARQFREALSMPLILLGGVNRLDTIEGALEEGFEFVAIARAQQDARP